MTRKFFSKLLMGAFLIASVSSFVSCKDYDDDINDLRSQINGLNTSVSTLVDSKISAVTNSVSTLQGELNGIKAAYAAADEALQKAVDEAKATGKANGEEIAKLQSTVAQLAAAQSNLESAIATLQASLAEANTTLKTQGETITGLLATDKVLQNGIDGAVANAANALAEAQKAQNQAAELNTALGELASTVASLNTTVATLQEQIKTLNGKVDELNTTAATNSANITTINAKLASLEQSDKDILAKLEAADKANLDNLNAQLKALAEKVQSNLDEITKIKDVTIAEVRNAMAGEAKSAVAEALKDALDGYITTEDVNALIKAANDENAKLLEALQAKVKQDSTDIRKYVDVEFLQVVKDLIAAEKNNTTAGTIAEAYAAADKKLQESITAVADDLQALAEQLNGNADSKGIVGQIEALQNQLKADENGLSQVGQSILDSKQFADAVSEAVGELNGEVYSMFTSINLFYNQHSHNGDSEANGYNALNGSFDHTLRFVTVTEVADVKFPRDATVTGGEQVEFKKDRLVTYEDKIMVRVSPASADLAQAAKDGNIALINSLGEDVVANGLIKITNVERVENVQNTPITRASVNSGLWVITFKLIDGEESNAETQEAFEKAASVNKNGQDRQVLYAVAIRNTTEKSNDRYIVSEFDLDLAQGKAYHGYPFDVAGKQVRTIRNRYEYCEGYNLARTESIDELSWKVNPAQEQTFTAYTYAEVDAYKALSDAQKAANVDGDYDANDGITIYNRTNQINGSSANYQHFWDNRQSQPLLKVVPGDGEIQITFDTTAPYLEDGTRGNFDTRIAGFYVTLDQEFALESAPSEINAWRSYDYDGTVGYVKADGTNEPAKLFKGNTGYIKILNKNNVIGDVIGFRVYAVNIDGTLVDPDGRAFYVRVVNKNELEYTTNSLSYSIEATSAYPTAKNPNAQEKAIDLKTEINYNDRVVYNYSLVWADNNPDIYTGSSWYSPIKGYTSYINSLFNVTFKHADGSYKTRYYSYYGPIAGRYAYSYGFQPWPIIDNDKVSAIKIALSDPDMLIDDQTYNLVMTITKDTYDHQVYDNTGNLTVSDDDNVMFKDTLQIVNIAIKKTIPTKYAPIAVKPGQSGDITYNMKPYEVTTGNATNIWDVRRLKESEPNYYDQMANFGAPIEKYNFADIYTLLNPENDFDQNFAFTIAKAGLDFSKTPAAAVDKTVGYNEGYWSQHATTSLDYDLPEIQKDEIGKTQSKNASIGYTYYGISLKKGANNAAVQNPVVVYSDSKFTYTFKNGYSLGFDGLKHDIDYLKAAPGATQTIKLSAVKLNKDLQTNIDFAAKDTPLKQLFADHLLEVVPGSATWSSNEYFFINGDNSYYGNQSLEDIITAGNDIQLTRVIRTVDPNFTDAAKKNGVAHTLTFKVRNLWGKVDTVTMTITMKIEQ